MGGPAGGIPDGQRQHRPGHPWLEGAVADAQQQGRGVVEAPLVRAAQVAVLDLVGQQVEGVQALEQRRCRSRRQGGIGGTEAVRHGCVMAARWAWRAGCRKCWVRWRRVARGIVGRPWPFGLAVDSACAWWREFAEPGASALPAPVARRPVLVDALLLRAPARHTGDGIAHGDGRPALASMGDASVDGLLSPVVAAPRAAAPVGANEGAPTPAD